MSVFRFIKNAGSKVFGPGKDTRQGTVKVDGQKDPSEEKENEMAARKLEKTIHDLNLTVEGLAIEISGETASIKGKAKSQSIREKVILVVGNVEGIGQVDDKMEVENKEPDSVFHTVETGETLGKIAKEHYGNVNQYTVIFEANKPMLKDPDKIYPGQVLRIPANK